MDDDIFNTIDESTFFGEDAQGQGNSPGKDDGKDQKKRGWRGLSALKAQASMQDKLLEKSVPDPSNHSTTHFPLPQLSIFLTVHLR